MNKKYRIKLKEGRIVGPFTKEQIGELYIKKRINGTELGQYFPAGDWKKIDDFPELAQLIVDIIAKKITLSDLTQKESKTIVNMSLASLQNKESTEPAQQQPLSPEFFNEFQYSKSSESKKTVDYEQLEAEYKQEKKERSIEETKVVVSSNDKPTVEKTVVRPGAIIPDETPAAVTERPQVDSPEIVDSSEEVEGPQLNSNEKTEFINLDAAVTDLKNIAQETESEIARHEEEILEEDKKTSTPIISNDKEEKEEEATPDKNKKRRKLLIGLVILLAIWMLFDSDKKDEEKITPIYPPIIFPISQEFIDANKSKDAYDKGILSYKKGTYTAKVSAAKYLKMSLEYKFKDNNALGELIRIYAELLPDAKDMPKAAKVIFDLMQIAKGKILTDINVAIGSGLFYKNYKKIQTALGVIENYLRLGKPTLQLMALYLELLTEAGNYIQAKNVFEKLQGVKRLPVEAYMAMITYLAADQRRDEIEKWVEQGLKEHPNSVQLRLEYTSLQLQNSNKDNFMSSLNMIKQLKAENSPRFYAKFLELLGILYAMNKDNAKAVAYFKEALTIHESNELRSKLASLELGGSNEVETLIRESKVVELVQMAKIEMKSRKWDIALRYAIEAVDLMETYIPAKLLLAEIQIRRGYFKEAINVLSKMQDQYPTNASVNFSLINAFIDSYKLNDALQQILAVKSSTFRETPEYASSLGRYYLKKENYILAIQWFQRSINRNPLNDRDYYYLSEIFIKLKKYDKAKMMLSKAMSLDPNQVDYLSLFARILYEMDGVQTAIGYLRKTLESHHDEPKLIGDIAKYYYRSGMLKEFEEYKTRIDNMLYPDESFYRFMVEASTLEDKFEDVVTYSRKLIQINPGDLPTKIFLGEHFLNRGQNDEAIKIFSEVKENLPSYPKVNYFLAKCYMNKNDHTKALEMGEEEIKQNPQLEFGYYIVGAIHKATQKYGEAIPMLEKAISLNTGSVETLLALGWIKHKQNYLEESRELYTRALREEPGNAEANRELGLVYKDIGQSKLAAESLKLYLDIRPNASDKAQIEQIIKQLK